MTYLQDVLDPWHLEQMVKEGYVRVQKHPVHPDLKIACYTKQAMFERAWNPTTRVCRGLIWSQKTGRILARPFSKFFNHGEPSAPVFSPTDLVEVTDKMDGSLGILYNSPEGLAVATKGSFASDQALWATEWLRTNLSYTDWQPPEGITFLFEIVYPENRIVLDYGKTQGLFFLASIDIATGRDVVLPKYDDPFATTEFFGWNHFGNVIEQYAGLERHNKEGIVVRRISDDARLKLKQQDYVELHRVMTGLNEKQLWQWACQGKTYDMIMESVPEELHSWAQPLLLDLFRKADDVWDRVEAILEKCPGGIRYDRKAFAEWVSHHDSLTKSCLFLLFDGQDDRAGKLIWKSVKP